MSIDASRRTSSLPPHPPLHDYYKQTNARQSFVNDLFNRTAMHYRRIDTATGFGSGLWYRRKALREAGLVPGMKVLDVACGPGLVTECAAHIVGQTGHVIGLDPSTGMLHEARNAAARISSAPSANAFLFRTDRLTFLAWGTRCDTSPI